MYLSQPAISRPYLAQFRGKGIGDALFARVAAAARANNCFGVMLNVLDWNRPAIAFFQKHQAQFLDGRKTACLEGEALLHVLAQEQLCLVSALWPFALLHWCHRSGKAGRRAETRRQAYVGKVSLVLQGSFSVLLSQS